MAPTTKIIGGSLFAYAKNGNDFALETNDFAVQFMLGQTGGIHLPLAPAIGTSLNCSATLAGAQALRNGYVPPPAPWFQYNVVGAGHVTVRLTAPIGSARTVTSYFYQFS